MAGVRDREELDKLRKLVVVIAVSAAWVLSAAAVVGWLLLAISNGYAPAIFISSLGVVALLLPIPIMLSRRASPHRMVSGSSRTNGTLKRVWKPDN